jgi:hypothetical protein
MEFLRVTFLNLAIENCETKRKSNACLHNSVTHERALGHTARLVKLPLCHRSYLKFSHLPNRIDTTGSQILTFRFW